MLFRTRLYRSCGRAWALLCVVAAAQAAAQDAASPPPSGPADLLSICGDALQLNPAYEAARAQFFAARQLLPLARGKLLPQLEAGAQFAWTHDDTDVTYYDIYHVSVNDTYTRTVYGAQLTQALYRPDLFLGLSKAEMQQKQASFGLDAAQDGLLIEVAQAYFAVLAARDALVFAKAETKTLAEQLDYISSRAEAGLATQANVKEAQAAHELAIADQTAAENTLAAARMSLEALTGKSYGELKVLPPNTPLAPPQPLDESVWVQRAQSENPQVLASRAALEIAKIERRVAQVGRYPKVDIVGTAYSLDNGGGITGDRNQDDAQIGIKFGMPLFTGGQLTAAIRGAEELQKKAEADERNAVAKAVRDTRIAYLNSSAGLQRVLALRRAVEAAIEAEASARAGYDAGTLTNADVLDAIDRRYQAEANYANARYMFLVNSLKLKQSAGNLLTADLAQINRLLQSPATAPAPTQH